MKKDTTRLEEATMTLHGEHIVIDSDVFQDAMGSSYYEQFGETAKILLSTQRFYELMESCEKDDWTDEELNKGWQLALP